MNIKNIIGTLFWASMFILYPEIVFAFEQDTRILQGRLTMLLVSLSVVGLVILYLIMRGFSAYRRKEVVNKKNEDSRIEFMVSTFHELVQKLKDKEKELTELRQIAEHRVEDIESYNIDILQSVPSGVVSFNEDYIITHINASAERILGVSSSECLNRPYQEIFGQTIAHVIGGNTYLERGEVVYETPSRKRVWLGLNVSPLKNRKGKPIGKIVVFTDLTDLKALESQMKLRESLSTLGEMSAGIAHELRNPMGVIAGYTKMLHKQVPEELQGAVIAIEKEIKMMDRIISDFMSFTHPLSVEKTPVPLKILIDDSIEIALANQPGIEVRKTFDPEITFLADGTLMRQVITNLLQNAADATGGQGLISVSAEKGPDSTRLSIKDTGHGISKDLHQKIFLPFYTTKEKGTGLGLAIVHKIVVSHGGNITFESSPKGTVFHVVLPDR